MKKNYVLINWAGILLFAFLFGAVQTNAQDTLVVESGVDLFQVVSADTVPGGGFAHDVYLLKNGGIYSESSPIFIYSNVAFIGEKGSNMPAFIRPAVDGAGEVPGSYFVVVGNDLTVTFENMILQGYTSDFQTTQTSMSGGIQVNGDACRLSVDGVIFNGFTGGAIDDPSLNAYSVIRNCKFRNLGDPKSEWSGWAYGHWWRRGGMDTLIMQNNTFINVGNSLVAAVGDGDLYRHITFEHNTIFGTKIHWAEIGGQPDVIMKDNIIYGPFNMGTQKRYAWIPENWGDTLHDATISMDTVAGANVPVMESFGFTEATRKYLWENNCTTWPDEMVQAWNHLDYDGSKIVEPVVTHEYAQIVIGAHEYATELNTITEDPEFDQATMDRYFPPVIDWITHNRQDEGWTGYFLIVDDPDHSYRLAWPLPEDLAYKNTALADAATDGYHLGDLNWFPNDKKKWEADHGLLGVNENKISIFSSLNNYPNPFNGVTTIQYTVKQSANVTMTVYDVYGKQVDVLVNENQTSGTYSVQWNGNNLAAGFYVCQLKSGTSTISKKMLLIK